MGEPDASVAAGLHVTFGPAAVLGEADAWLGDGAGETTGVGEGAGEQAARNKVVARSNRLIPGS
jgi:hypothetical protein